MGRLERKLDIDLIAKIESGWKPGSMAEPLKRQKPVRQAATYRGARRQMAKITKHWDGITPTMKASYSAFRQNRSKHWKGQDASYN